MWWPCKKPRDRRLVGKGKKNGTKEKKKDRNL